MASLLPAFLLVATLHVVCASEWSAGLFILATYCSWGCCYADTDTCCYVAFYRTTKFIAPLTVGICVLVFSLLVKICCCYSRRETTTTTVQYGAPPTQQVYVVGSH